MNYLDVSIFFVLNGFAHVSAAFDFIIVLLARYLAYPATLLPFLIFLKPEWRTKRVLVDVGFIYAAAVLGRFIITPLIRATFPVERPFEIFSEAARLIPHEASASFPSGHAVFFFALAMGVWFIHRRLGGYMLVLAFFMGVARIMAGVHWPADILAGAVVGIVISLITFSIARRFQSNAPQ